MLRLAILFLLLAVRGISEPLDAYLHARLPGRIEQVSVGAEQIQIEGVTPAPFTDVWLAEVPMETDATLAASYHPCRALTPDSNGGFKVTVPRARESGGRPLDPLLSRWAIVRRGATGLEPLSHARYAEAVAARWPAPTETARGKKGVGALGLERPLEDLEGLGLTAATVNIVLNSFMRLEAGEGRTAFTYAGRTWYTEDRVVAALDRTLLEASQRRLLVSAIILVSPPPKTGSPGSYTALVAHPDATAAGIFAMPAVSTESGLAAYAAALDFLAQRYSQPEAPHGRIHYWIMHNEVNSGWNWTNAGEKSDAAYVDLYTKSMRAAHLIARQYNPAAQVFISLEHHWMVHQPHCTPGRAVLEWLCAHSAAEGDFPWGLAHHPYPQDLFEPRVWDNPEATFSFDTPKITFRNLEVLVAWMSRPAARYLGKEVRTIHLTEQGLNSRDYSEESLRLQAAGMAYAWNKVKRLPAISLFHYHNWVDNRAEGGVRLGLRKFPDEPGDPQGRKPIWHVYQALETPGEEAAAAFALPLVGVESWDEVMFRGEIR